MKYFFESTHFHGVSHTSLHFHGASRTVSDLVTGVTNTDLISSKIVQIMLESLLKCKIYGMLE
uniref:Putative ovule protein n=1 Tax=Solanum chacoense TaxID=4108 RepID=A0A0V0H6V5_SOLCH